MFIAASSTTVSTVRIVNHLPHDERPSQSQIRKTRRGYIKDLRETEVARNIAAMHQKAAKEALNNVSTARGSDENVAAEEEWSKSVLEPKG